MLDFRSALLTACQAFRTIGDEATGTDIVDGLSAFDGILRGFLPAVRTACAEAGKCQSCFFSSEVAPCVCQALVAIGYQYQECFN
jgi:hypothetical protein